MKDGVILMNMGHGNMEIDTEYLNSKEYIKEDIKPLLNKYTKEDGKSLFLLCDGYLVNATGGAGHPPRVMSITFTNHFIALLSMLQNPEFYRDKKVYKLNRRQEELIARLNFPELSNKLSKLTEEQSEYLGISPNGPFKREDYRY
jgi:adenosylhomocysteinase